MAQGLYQVDFGWNEADWLGNLGFYKYSPSAFYLLVDLVPIVFLTSYMRLRQNSSTILSKVGP